MQEKTLCEKGVVGQPFELFRLHFSAGSAKNSSDFGFQIYTSNPTGQIPNLVNLLVVVASM
jgi:hypothetical protein